ncbi:MAG: 3-dehydroquinate synthase [Succinivibrionaceae bacterium]
MKELVVDLGDRSYPIFIEQGLLLNPEVWKSYITKKSHVVVVTNTTVQTWYLEPLMNSLLKSGFKTYACILPDGEQYKNLESFNQIMTFLLEHNCGRDTTLIALGGGVIGDLTGYAAASFQRGIDFIQIPTTLLSHVDSSVGGKTGINHPLGKNMIGAFYQPKAVVIDLDCLKTLPNRELAAGMAEVIKYGIIWDNEFFKYLEEHASDIKNLDFAVLSEVIYKCCCIKADVVHQDEKESGIRAILNLGHTFGHAIETFMGYGVWLHGEGVAVGMVMAAQVALSRGYITLNEFERIKVLINSVGLPIKKPENMNTEDFLKIMVHDKKAQNGKVRFIIPTKLGGASLFGDVSQNEIQEVTA